MTLGAALLLLQAALQRANKLAGMLGGFGLRHWRELLIGMLLAMVWQQRSEIRRKDAALVAVFEAHQQAAAASRLRGAETGQEAVQAHVERIEQDRPAVERVVTRLRNICVRQPPAGDLPVPAGPASTDDARDAARNARDRAFADAAGRDLARCSTELSRLAALQDWVRANGGQPRPVTPDAHEPAP